MLWSCSKFHILGIGSRVGFEDMKACKGNRGWKGVKEPGHGGIWRWEKNHRQMPVKVNLSLTDVLPWIYEGENPGSLVLWWTRVQTGLHYPDRRLKSVSASLRKWQKKKKKWLFWTLDDYWALLVKTTTFYLNWFLNNIHTNKPGRSIVSSYCVLSVQMAQIYTVINIDSPRKTFVIKTKKKR